MLSIVIPFHWGLLGNYSGYPLPHFYFNIKSSGSVVLFPALRFSS